MKPLKRRPEKEKAIEIRIRKLLKAQGCLTRKAHGNKFMAGWPDLLVLHPDYPARWVEVKRPGGRLSATQKDSFALWESHGALIWVLDSDDLTLLDGTPNWREWL